jgi:3-oxoacyl-[acyl-carrier-protein] synthase III
MTLKNKVAIVGVGESDIGKVPHLSGLGLNAQASKRALDDAGLKPSDIEACSTRSPSRTRCLARRCASTWA